MCGIAGIVMSERSELLLRDTLILMQTAMRHRGPDDVGHYLAPDGRAGLVHTRLSILDLSEAGHQPMFSSDERYIITFNGEIYNFKALRDVLISDGEVFQTQTDTEVILKLYSRRGAACVEDLEGMYAFAIWDTQERRLFAARDPLGIKPLYFSVSNGRLCFASEMRALLTSGMVPRQMAPSALFAYLLFGSVPEPTTLVTNVERLPPGHCLEWTSGKTRVWLHWKLDYRSEEPCPKDPASATRTFLLESLQRHFVSDVPVGLFLSGGIDSTALLALSARELGVAPDTFCISFDDAAFNEGESASQTARHFGATHHEMRLDPGTGIAILRDFLNVLDHPSIDGFNTFCVSRFAANRGMKVVLSGMGGDELFAGYPSFTRVPRLLDWGRLAFTIPPAARRAGRWLETRSHQPRSRRLGFFLQRPPSTGLAYWTLRGIFSPAEAARLTSHYLGSEASLLPDPLEFVGLDPQPSLEDEVSCLETTRYLCNQLLRDGDVMSMACGLELRVPFVDRRLLRSLSAIPASNRLRQGKQLLLAAVPEIPDWVKNRPKQGFVFPFETWLHEEWKEDFAGIDARTPVALLTWYRRWALLALETFIEGNGLKP